VAESVSSPSQALEPSVTPNARTHASNQSSDD
jgi:hypothetical protein